MAATSQNCGGKPPSDPLISPPPAGYSQNPALSESATSGKPIDVVKPTDTRIPSLDGMRAASVAIVFGTHAGFARETVGGLGVNIFFFLSGFLITTLMRLEYEANGSVNLKRFWMRRALRVLPPFYAVALAATVLT